MDNKKTNVPYQTIRIQDCYPSEMIDGSPVADNSNKQNINGQNREQMSINSGNLIENLVKNLSQNGSSGLGAISNLLSNGGVDMGALLPLISSLSSGNNTSNGTNIMSLLNNLSSKNTANNAKNNANKTKINDFKRIEKE